MKILLTHLVILFYCTTSAQIEKKYYTNTTTLKEIGNLKDGLKDGFWEEYYENGKIKTSGNYVMGEKNGNWKIYFDNGVLAGDGDYLSTKFPKKGTWKFYSEDGNKREYKCEPATKDDLSLICNSMYQKFQARNPDSGMSYLHQEEIWDVSCADVGNETLETARIKIQIMWNESRERFRCYNYSTSAFTDTNITKFSIDSGFSGLIVEFVRKYQLDMNFIDPADNKTILDFLAEQEDIIRNTRRVDTDKAYEYQRIYQLLKSNGAKHSSELIK